MKVLTSYTFQVVALGTVLLAITAAIVGSLNVYKGQSLIRDAIGHAAFPGVILAYMLTTSRNPVFLLIGAILVGGLAYFLIQASDRYSKIGLDANLAIYLSGFFGLGMVLKSHIQGNPAYGGASQAGLDNYIFGQAAYIREVDVVLIGLVAVISLVLLLAFYKEIKLAIFDPEYAKVIGIPTGLINTVIQWMTILVIGVGIKAVGTVLISSFLVIFAIAADMWTDDFTSVLLLAGFFGAFSALVGTYISSIKAGMSTGPTIIMVAGLVVLLSMVFGKKGPVAKMKRR